MKVLIEINCDNSCFCDHNNAELSRILKETADLVVSDQWYSLDKDKVALFDLNGNKVGELRIKE